MKRRTHSKRSSVSKLSKLRATIKRRMDQTIERDGRMELAHALLSLQQCKRFILNAERLTGKTMAVAFAVIMLQACTVTLPVTATSVPIGPRQGTAKATQVLGAWITGDASIQAAARAGDIHQVSTVDLRTTNVLGVYIRRTCIVTGQ